MRRALLLVLPAVLAGCGASGSGDRPGAGAGTGASLSPRAIPATELRQAARVARTHVQAVEARDGKRFCATLAPWVSGRLDAVGAELDLAGSVDDRFDCALLVHRFIDYVVDCCSPRLAHVALAQLELEPDGDLIRGEARYRVDETTEGRHASRTVRDVLWLTKEGGRWRIARLGNLAVLAHLDKVGAGIPIGVRRPDVAGQRNAYADDVEKLVDHAKERATAYTSPGAAARCGGLRVRDGSAPADVQADRYGSPAGAGPPPRRADLTAADLRAAGDDVCLAVETRAPLGNDLNLDLVLTDGAAPAPGKPGYVRDFHVDVRADGQARVTSGWDRRGRPLTVPARVGRTGTRLSLLLDRRSFEASAAQPGRGGSRDGRFRFTVSLVTRLQPRWWVRDVLDRPGRGSTFRYPSGAPCGTPEC